MDNTERPIDEFADRARRKKRGGVAGDRRTFHLPALPLRVWQWRKMVVPFEKIGSETFGIARPEDEIAPGHRGYQREEVTTKVRELADVYRRVPGETAATEPIHAVLRAWENERRRLWIVDGQERMWAALDAKKGLVVLIHLVQKPEEERALFDIFNNRVGVNSNLRVWNHIGPVRDLVVGTNENASGSLFQRIAFGTSRRTRMSAVTVIHALSIVAGCRSAQIDRQLGLLDHYIKQGGVGLLQEFLNALGLLFFLPPPGIPFGASQIQAFAKAWRRANVRSIDARTMARLRRAGSTLSSVTASTHQERVELMMRRLLRILTPSEAVA